MGVRYRTADAAVEKTRAAMEKAPVAVAVDCTGMISGVVAILLLFGGQIWAATIPGAIMIASGSLNEHFGGRAPLSRGYKASITAACLLVLIGLVVGLWLHTVRSDLAFAIPALTATATLALLVVATSPWAHWLDRLGGDEDE